MALAALEQAGTELATPAQHRAVWATFTLEVTSSSLQASMPLSSPEMCRPLEEEKVHGWAWRHLEWELEMALRSLDVEGTWSLWCRRWEALLIKRMQTHANTAPTSAHRGRGRLPVERRQGFHAPRSQYGGTWPLRVRQLQRVAGLCHEALLQHQRRGWLEVGLYTNLNRKLAQHGFKEDESDLNPGDLQWLLEQIHEQLNAAKDAAKHDRVSRWKTALQQQGMKKAFAFVGAKKFVAMTGVKAPNGEKPTSLSKITEALLEYWKGIFNHEPETYLPNLISNIVVQGMADLQLRSPIIEFEMSRPRTSLVLLVT